MKKRGVLTGIALLLALSLLLSSCAISFGDGASKKDAEESGFTVTFDAQGGTETDPEQVQDGQKATRPQDPVKAGYIFDGWTYEGEPWSFDEQVVTEDITLTAKWTAENYTVAYTLNGGAAAEENPTAFTIESEAFTLSAPARAGYVFTGWTWENQEEPQLSVTVPAGTHENKAFVANWQAIVYTVTYLGGGAVPPGTPDTFTADSENRVIGQCERTGYTFIGWTWEGQTEPQLSYTIPADTYEDLTLTTNWQANTYTVTLNANGGTVAEESLTVTYDETYTLPTPERAGYDFTGWYQNDVLYQGNETWLMTEALDLTAHWTPVVYTITYYTLENCDDPALNPASFTVEDETITLIAPTKTGYTFTGWTWEGQAEPQLSASVPAGTHENQVFTAHWQAISYTVTYTLCGGTNAEGNPGAFNVESEAFTLAAPTRTGYTFTGWTWEGQTEPQLSVTVPAGTHEDKAFVANWQANTYTVIFDTDGGDPLESLTVTYEEPYTLPIPTKTGYAFNGWYEGDVSVINGTWQTTAGKTLKARWRIVNYNVSYTLNGGTGAQSNPKKYTIESDAFTLAAPVRTGYTFTGWTWEGQTEPQLSVTVPTGSHGSKTFVANWDVLWKDIDDLTDVDGDFVPVIRFAVTSDIHTRFMGEGDPNNTTTDEVAAAARRTAGMFDYSYQYAAKSAYTDLDAVIVVGDYTDYGHPKQYQAFLDVVNAEMQAGTELLVCLGNHEFWATGENGSNATVTTQTYARFEEFFGHAPDSHDVIGGYHFIGVSPDCNGGRNYSAAKAAWLSEQLQIAAADDPTGQKPIIVYEHISPSGTVYGSSSTTNPDAAYAAITTGQVMENYPQVVLFAGHSHRPVTDPASVMQTDYTVFNTGSLTYGSLEIYTGSGGSTTGALPLGLDGDWYNNMNDNWYEHGEKEQSVYILIELDANNRMRVQYIDADSGRLLQEPIIIDSIGRTEDFTLTRARGETSEIPYFDPLAAIEVAEVYPTAVTLTFPQALCRDKVRDYKVELYQSGNLKQTIYRLSNIYFSNAPDTLTIPFTGLQSSTTYQVKVYAYNTWGKISTEPLIGSFTTASSAGAMTPDVFSLAFREDGTPYDAVSGEDLVKNGNPTTAVDDMLDRTVGVFDNSSDEAKGDYQWRDLVEKRELLRHGFTFEVYAKINAIPGSSYVDIVSAQQNGGFGFELTSAGKVCFYLYSKSSKSYVSPRANVTAGEYVHLVGTCDGTNVCLYINGELAASATLSGGEVFFPVKNSACYLSIGADASPDYNSSSHFSGKVASTNIYTTALTAEQVAVLYQNR